MIELILLRVYPDPLPVALVYLASAIAAYIHLTHFMKESIGSASTNGPVDSIGGVRFPIFLISMTGILGLIASIGLTLTVHFR